MDSEPGWTLVAKLAVPDEDSKNQTEERLAALGHAFAGQSIEHRFDRQDHSIGVWIAKASDAEQAIEILEYLDRSSASDSNTNPVVSQSATLAPGLANFFRELPVVAVCILLSMVGALLVRFRFDLVHYFTFQDFVLVGEHVGFYPLGYAYESGQYWRVLTPAFLHFGIFHLAFNCLWVWELGRRVERLAGSRHLLALVLLTGTASNLAQYTWGGPSLFGGMSGVVYGLVGYVWIRHRMAPHPILAVPPGIIVFMFAWLFIGMTGLIDLLMSGSIANAAHVGGLVAGIALGWWAGRS